MAHISLKKDYKFPFLKKKCRGLFPTKHPLKSVLTENILGRRRKRNCTSKEPSDLAIICQEEPVRLDPEGVLSRAPEHKVG